MAKLHVATLGCRLNQAESDSLKAQLVARGHTLMAEAAGAEGILLNTCTITHAADQEAQALVRRYHRQTPTAKIVVTGCFATAQAEVVGSLPGVTHVVPNGLKGDIPDTAFSSPSAPPAPPLHAPRDLPAALPDHRSRAYLKVQDGCDYRCAFCIVPAVRGRSRSLDPLTLVAQLRRLVGAGIPEVVLTGVHLGTYGRDLKPRLSLAALVRRLLPHLGRARLRLSSLDPHEVDDDIIALLKGSQGRLCRYLHLPIQSAHPDVLRRMRRAHTVADMHKLMQRLMGVPHMGLGSDVIAGFPGESESEFAASYAALKGWPLSYLHVFSYSRRAGTRAATLPDQVDRGVIARRSRVLRQLSAAHRLSFYRNQVGCTRRVVVHRARHARTGLLMGVTDNFVKVRFAGPDALAGGAVDVRLEGADAHGAWGTCISHQCCG